jgi:hypothetical protein
MALKEFSPGTLWNSLCARLPLHLENAVLDADLSLATRDLKTWRLSFDTTALDIAFSEKGVPLHVIGDRAAGEFDIDGGGIHAIISELDLQTPSVRAKGSFDLNPRTPLVAWHADVENLDIGSTRPALLFFTSRFKTARHLSRSFLRGAIPQMKLGQKATSLENLRDERTFYLQGALENGLFFIPHADLLLHDSFGQATMIDGILTASDLRARLGDASGNQGNFILNVAEEKPLPFSVACNIETNLAHLPPILERVATNADLAKEMAGISFAEGSAKGLLVLEKNHGPLQVSVDVSTFELSAAYHRIPFPVTLSGGGFTYRNGHVLVQNVQGNIGDSPFTDLTAGISWDTTPHLSISSLQADIDAWETVSWLGNFFEACRTADGGAPATGRIYLENTRFEGPVCDPKGWHFQSDGYVTENLTVHPPLFPEALSISRSEFTLTHEKLDFMDMDLSILGARLFASGSLEDYFEGTPRKADALLVGSLGQTITKWIMGHADFPNRSNGGRR